jgi:hypothetical protein
MRKTHVIDGIAYVEVKREAEVGDKVLIVNATATNGMYKNGDIIIAEKTNGYGIFNKKVRSAANYCYNPNGFIDEIEYYVLEPLDSDEASPDVTALIANLARRVASLEQQLSATQSNVENLAEELANTKHRVSKHATMFGIVEERVGMLTSDIITLDERTQVINAINKFYEEGSR